MLQDGSLRAELPPSLSDHPADISSTTISTAMAQKTKLADSEVLEETFQSDVELEDSSDSSCDSEEEEKLEKGHLIDPVIEGKPEPSNSTRSHPPSTFDEASSSMFDDSAAESDDDYAPLLRQSDDSAAESDDDYVPLLRQTSSRSGRAPAPKRKTNSSKPARKRQKVSTSVHQHVDQDNWHTVDEPDVEPECPTFYPKNPPGPQIDTTQTWSPLSLFKLFISAVTIRQIINNTNENAERLIAAGKKYKWSPVTVDDFYKFLAIIIFTGLVHVPSKSDYWRAKWPYNFQFPRNCMTRDRFSVIFWSLHLSNIKDDAENDKKKGTPDYDRLFKIKPLYDDIRVACKSLFQPSREICIDERMVASKARIDFKQFMKDKPTRFGYKLYVLADSRTGYTWNFYIYQGKSGLVREEDLSTTSVMNLMEFGLLGKGYQLYVDNFYTSPCLFKKLSSNNTAACGTIRHNRVGFPKTTRNNLPKSAKRGEMRWLRKDGLLFVKWIDSKEVSVCSTFHRAFSGETVKRRVKEAGQWSVKNISVPDSVKDYNKFMGGVDLSDALIQYYSVKSKTMKWYKAFFFHFIDIAVVNSFIIFKMLAMQRGEKPISQRKFREKLMEELMKDPKAGAAGEDFLQPSSSFPPQPCSSTKKCIPKYFGETAGDKRRNCVWCKQNGIVRKTPLYCPKCEVSLCLQPDRNCFEDYHKTV